MCSRIASATNTSDSAIVGAASVFLGSTEIERRRNAPGAVLVVASTRMQPGRQERVRVNVHGGTPQGRPSSWRRLPSPKRGKTTAKYPLNSSRQRQAHHLGRSPPPPDVCDRDRGLTTRGVRPEAKCRALGPA